MLEHSSDGGMQRVVVAQNDEGAVKLEVCYDQRRQAISEVTMTMLGYRGQPNEGVLTATIKYSVQEWRKVGDLWIAWKAVREATNYDTESQLDRRKPPMVHRIGMLRRSFELPPEAFPKATFDRPAVVRGIGVADSTLGIGYMIGDTYVTIDGKAYELAAAVSTYITADDLARLLQDPQTHLMAPSDP
jgi:hypothetical protein